MVYGLHQALPPRFRVGDGARPVWLANVAIMNALRQIPAFAGAVNPILNDNQPDTIPEMLSPRRVRGLGDGRVSNVVSGHKNLAILDMNSFIITNRQPELLIYEPLFKDQATGAPDRPGRMVLLVADRVGPDHGDRLPVPHHLGDDDGGEQGQEFTCDGQHPGPVHGMQRHRMRDTADRPVLRVLFSLEGFPAALSRGAYRPARPPPGTSTCSSLVTPAPNRLCSVPVAPELAAAWLAVCGVGSNDEARGDTQPRLLGQRAR